jgi:spore coat polysaccharide biosynthesis protein SpsF (cytidylyltransferase family)
VDTEADLEFVRAVHERLGAMAETAGMDDVLELLRRHPELEAINRGTARNEGYANSVRADRVTIERRG